MQLQAQCFKQDIKIIHEVHGKILHVFPEGGEVYHDQIVLTTKDKVLTTIVRARDFSTIKKYHKKVRKLLDSKLGYSVINGVIPQKLSPCKKGVSV